MPRLVTDNHITKDERKRLFSVFFDDTITGRTASWADIAGASGVSRQYLYMIKSGECMPSFTVIALLCFWLKVDINKMVNQLATALIGDIDYKDMKTAVKNERIRRLKSTLRDLENS